MEEILDAHRYSRTVKSRRAHVSCVLRTLHLELVSAVAEDVNKNRQVHLTFEVVGPAWQSIAGNHYIHSQKKIHIGDSDPGSNLETIKEPKTLI